VHINRLRKKSFAKVRQVSGHDLGRAERSLLRVKDVGNKHFLAAAGQRVAPGFGAERPKKFFFSQPVNSWSKRFAIGKVLLFGLLLGSVMYPVYRADSQAADTTRKVKSSAPPEYPELARKLNIKGIVRIQAVVSPEGNVKDIKELGGNPVLMDALVRAVKKWKYEPASRESLVEVKFEFK
jgi:TonB family protein